MQFFWIAKLIDELLNLYSWVVIGSAVASWLLAFGVVNPRNRAVHAIIETLYRVTEPALRPIRRILPNFGGVDVSPVVLLLLIFVARMLLQKNIWPALTGVPWPN